MVMTNTSLETNSIPNLLGLETDTQTRSYERHHIWIVDIIEQSRKFTKRDISTLLLSIYSPSPRIDSDRW